jgi:hypothetical protein
MTKQHYTPADGYTRLVGRETHGIELIEFGILRLGPGAQYGARSDGRETGP